MIIRKMIKWYSTDGTEYDGKFWLSISLMGYAVESKILKSFPKEFDCDVVIEKYYDRFKWSLLKWWIFRGFRINKMKLSEIF